MRRNDERRICELKFSLWIGNCACRMHVWVPLNPKLLVPNTKYQMTDSDGDWYEERPTLNDGSGWALNLECYYLKLPKLSKDAHSYA